MPEARTNLRSASEIWETALGELQVEVSKPNYETWLKNTIGLSYEKDYFTIGVLNTFVGEWLNKHLRSLIAKTLFRVIGADTQIRFLVCNPKKALPTMAIATETDGGISQLAEVSPHQFNPKYTFDTFVVGDCNRFAYSTALTVAKQIPNDYNPLFIYGGSGLGKTHLLHAIGHVTTANGLRTVYVTAEQFTNELVKALKEERTEDFYNKFRNAQVLLVDDIDFLSGKRQIQESFLHTFKELYHKNSQMVIAGDNHPKLIPLLSYKLRSRLGWGLAVEIRPLEMTTRLAILELKAKEKGLSLPTEVLEFLATQAQAEGRELEGTLKQVAAYARLKKANIDLRLAQESLTNISTPESQVVSPKIVKQIVADYFRISPELLVAKKKDRNTSLARQVAMYLLKEEGHYSFSEIGAEFGNRNHSTVLYNCRKIAEKLETEPKFRSLMSEITQTIRLTKNNRLFRN